MSIHVALNHISHYSYDRLVALSPQIVRLRPAPHCRTPILSYSLKITPAGHFINWQQDPQSNYLARLVFPEKTREFRVEVDLVADMAVINPFDFFLEPQADKFPFAYEDWQLRELAPYMVKLPATPLFAKYLDTIPRAPKHSVDFLVDINRELQQQIRYLIRLEPGVQAPEQTLGLGSGSCRDSAWLLVQLLRHLGLAARFVSGYLIQLTPDVKSLDGPSGPAADFTDLHAWAEVYLPGAGWIGLDPTSGLFAGEGHIPLACTPEPTSAAPVTGYAEKAECEFSHTMRVERIWEAPRVTKPYTEEQWTRIESLGHSIDAELQAGDVRLTMGGEPTFVSVDDPDGAEWNTAALGPTKRRLAEGLLAKLRAKYAPQGFLHYGQGKWYPGEQLPRWSLGVWWRRDGEPMWASSALFADEGTDYGVTDAAARRFLERVAERLGVGGRHLMPAHEDVWYYLSRERRLPSNVDPFDARLDDPLERDRLRKVFGQGLNKVVGWVLPVARDHALPAWRSGPWFLREERLYLIPGDSPLGFRLPLGSQPWAAETDYPWIFPPDQSRPFPALQPYSSLREQFQSRIPLTGEDGAPGAAAAQRRGILPADEAAARRPAPFQSADWIVRTALCAEPRNGVLYVFMPPLAELEHYLELVAACEATAGELGQPVLFEGYEPPKDPRVDHIRVTPDPGVIEVNIHASKSWDELVDHTEHLYEAARQSRLATEKFMLDGQHTGTGGGNHFVLGGATIADSPFLRRPDLLRSLISYWHNHPALSFLFSGMFIGPTSQHPRVDEARNDSVYELETAFRQFPPAGQECAPWLVDRLLRNLLIDVTGNTHRTEFCIDKLYSPDGPTGRLGLLELRAFEMPPHARMSLTQQLLMRALVARFWREPYAPVRLKRWGTELHDRFMLPYFVQQDLDDVIDEMRAAGYPLEAAWFAPHFEFRFPFYGDFAARSVDVELRHALEPWHVMGEEGAPGGTARYVDSSVERLQVRVTGLIDERHVLTCNGRIVPLASTGRVGEYVAGVRYKAWQPPSALHPAIPSHNPLVFDLVDTWMSRSLGGAQYHVAHPGGRHYEHFPVNAYEAEARRRARFFRIGHTPGRMQVPPAERNPNFPFTLDLRRA